MPLVRLIYASRAARLMGMREMVSLLDKAQQHNAARDITGMLAFNREGFLQVIEGGSEAVNDLYHRIAVDPRHHQMTLIGFGEVAERQFADWNMAALDVVALDADRRSGTLLRYGASAMFDPFALGEDAALRLLAAWRTEIVTPH